MIINPLVTEGQTFNSAAFDGIYLEYNFNGGTFLKVKPDNDDSRCFDYVRII